VVVGGNGAEGFTGRAAVDEVVVWHKPAKAIDVQARPRSGLTLVRQQAPHDLGVHPAQDVVAS
jgi:hypothetical protein